jgi:hypothetical protein
MMPTGQINPPHASIGSAPLTAPVVPLAFAPRQGMGDILTPLKPQHRPSLSGVGTNKQAPKDILNDFDPLA